MVCGLPPFSFGRGRFSMSARLHVGKGAEHHQQFGQVDELGKAAAGFQRLAVGRNLHRLDHFPEGGRPGVEMIQPTAFEAGGVEVALHRVHLDHAVGNRRAGGAGDAVAGMQLVEIAAFHVEVEGPLASRRSGCRRRDPSSSAFADS